MCAGDSCINPDPSLTAGIQGLEPGHQVMVTFYFERTQDFELLRNPRGDRTPSRRGVFCIRSPWRPNPIGVTVIEVLSVDDKVLTVRGLDAFDDTPVLNLKPV